MYRRPYSNCACARLPCCLWKGILKPDFSDIYLIPFFGDGNFGKKLAMGVIFFLKKKKNYELTEE